jgi:hypothetical protein
MTDKKKKCGEKWLEKKLCTEITLSGGLALKFGTPYHTGMPDRLVMMPGGRMAFVELKTEGRRPTRLQEKNISRLRVMGFEVWVIDDDLKLNAFLWRMRYGL